jgi:predicted ATPase
VGNILYYSGDEFETTDDITELAMESEEELVDRLINLLDYYYDKANELS